MIIRYANGRLVDVENEAEARSILDAEYPDAVYHDEWEPESPGTERLLVWENDDDAGPLGFGDGGQNAVASIVREI